MIVYSAAGESQSSFLAVDRNTTLYNATDTNCRDAGAGTAAAMIHSRQNLVAQLSFNGPEQTKVQGQGRCCVTTVMVQWLAGCGWLLWVGLAVWVQYS